MKHGYHALSSVLSIGVLTLISTGSGALKLAGESQVVENAFFVFGLPRELVEQAFDRGQALIRTPRGEVQAGILPHHDLASAYTAAFFQGLRRQTPPSTIVIIGPDHKNTGPGEVTTSKKPWVTSVGAVDVNQNMVETLFRQGKVAIADEVIRDEHSVYTALPFFKRVFPSSSVVPLIIRSNADPKDVRSLAIALDQQLAPNDLVLASVDFSHYQNILRAQREDARSLQVLRKSDSIEARSIPVDSPLAISLLLEYSKVRKLTFQELHHTNSAELLAELSLSSTTSYLTAYFYK